MRVAGACARAPVTRRPRRATVRPSASAWSSGSSGTGRRYTRPDERFATSRALLMRAEDLTKTLDLTVVEPDMTEEDLERFCAAAREHHFAALCTHPRFVPRMAELLKGCDVKSCAVIDFPAGDSTPLERAQQADRAVAEGADEIDVVLASPLRRTRETAAIIAEVRVRRLRTSVERHTSHEQPMTGLPLLVPVPRKVICINSCINRRKGSSAKIRATGSIAIALQPLRDHFASKDGTNRAGS